MTHDEFEITLQWQRKAIAQRDERIKELEHQLNRASDNQAHMGNELEALRVLGCDGCIHKPLQGENYYEPCGECRRFYGDFYEPKNKE